MSRFLLIIQPGFDHRELKIPSIDLSLEKEPVSVLYYKSYQIISKGFIEFNPDLIFYLTRESFYGIGKYY